MNDGGPTQCRGGKMCEGAVNRAGCGSELSQRGRMWRTAAVHAALRPRRAHAANHVRCCSIHRASGIRLPPGRLSGIAQYESSFRIERARRTLQRLALVAVKASSRVAHVTLAGPSNPLSWLARAPSARDESTHGAFPLIFVLDSP
jgi:hypothetical protein